MSSSAHSGRLRPAVWRTCRALALLALLSSCSTSGAGRDESSAAVHSPAGIAPVVERAERAEAAGDWDTAIEAWAATLERTPWNSRIRQRLVAAYVERAAQTRRAGSLPAAEADLRAAAAVAPEDPHVSRALAIVLAERAARSLDGDRAAALRSEALALAPGLDVDLDRDARLERRLDLAFELLDRGQLEAGIQRLETLRGAHPGHLPVARLLAQARVRRAGALAERKNYDGAGAELDLAVAAYRPFGSCGTDPSTTCTRDEIRTAHHNRIVVWSKAAERARARRALSEAQELGFRFPKLQARLGAPEPE